MRFLYLLCFSQRKRCFLNSVLFNLSYLYSIHFSFENNSKNAYFSAYFAFLKSHENPPITNYSFFHFNSSNSSPYFPNNYSLNNFSLQNSAQISFYSKHKVLLFSSIQHFNKSHYYINSLYSPKLSFHFQKPIFQSYSTSKQTHYSHQTHSNWKTTTSKHFY